MREKKEITQEDFHGLLGRFSSDPETAGKKYEDIRAGLINYFSFRGCRDAEALTDETINRVAVKIAGTSFDEKFNFASYFYAFASKIHLEDCKKRKRFVSEYEDVPVPPEVEETDPGIDCLNDCLAQCPPADRSLLITYYGFEKSERAAERRRLAEERHMNILFLHTKISRLKKVLRECLRNCLAGEKI